MRRRQVRGWRRARERLKNEYIDTLDFERMVANEDRPDTLSYCDPPYWMMLEKGGRPYYQCGFEEEDHVRLRETLAGVKGKVILTYDDHPEVSGSTRASPSARPVRSTTRRITAPAPSLATAGVADSELVRDMRPSSRNVRCGLLPVVNNLHDSWSAHLRRV